MAGKAGHVINACEHIQEVSFRNFFDESLLQLCKVCRGRFCSQFFERWLSFLIDD